MVAQLVLSPIAVHNASLANLSLGKVFNITKILNISSIIARVGYRLNFIDSDSAYRFRFVSIPM